MSLTGKSPSGHQTHLRNRRRHVSRSPPGPHAERAADGSSRSDTIARVADTFNMEISPIYNVILVGGSGVAETQSFPPGRDGDLPWYTVFAWTDENSPNIVGLYPPTDRLRGPHRYRRADRRRVRRTSRSRCGDRVRRPNDLHERDRLSSTRRPRERSDGRRSTWMGSTPSGSPSPTGSRRCSIPSSTWTGS